MSKDVEKAYKAYPLTEDNRLNHEWNAKRLGFQQGYHQAEKDLELTWEDIEKIYLLVIETDNEYLEANADNDYEYDVKEMNLEVLKRFKAQK